MNSTQSFGVPSHSQAALTSGPETHAHSPRRRKVHNAASSCYSGHSFQTARPPTAFDMPDPFVDNQSLRSTPSFHPLPMNGQNMMSRPSPQGKGFELRLPDDQFARLIEALSPRARSRYVTPSEQANQQANQILASTVDSSSQPSVLVGPPLDPKQQSAATQRAQNGGGMTLWDSFYASRASDGKHGRDPTDISMHMGCTDFPNCHHDGPHETQVTIDSPAKRVKGKKEGSGSKEKGKYLFSDLSTADCSLLSQHSQIKSVIIHLQMSVTSLPQPIRALSPPRLLSSPNNTFRQMERRGSGQRLEVERASRLVRPQWRERRKRYQQDLAAASQRCYRKGKTRRTRRRLFVLKFAKRSRGILFCEI